MDSILSKQLPVTTLADKNKIDDTTKVYLYESQNVLGDYEIDWSQVYYLDFDKAKISKNINLGEDTSISIEEKIIFDTKGNNLIYNNGIKIDEITYYTYSEIINNSKNKEQDLESLKTNKIFASLDDQTYVVKNTGETYAVGKVDYKNFIGRSNSDFVDLENDLLKTTATLLPEESLCIGESATYIKKTDGTVYAVGNNQSGQLGVGDTQNCNELKKVKIDNVKQIPSSVVNTMVFLKENGDVYACGVNYFNYFNGPFNLINDNGEAYYTEPVKVEGINDVEKILYVSDFNITVMKKDGTVWQWGSDCFGSFGMGSLKNSRIPTRYENLEAIAAAKGTKIKDVQSRITTIALFENGEVYTTGYGAYAAIGNGSLTQRNTFTQTPILTNVKSVHIGNTSFYAILNDGTVYGWGGNGVLGTIANENGSVSVVPKPSLVDIKNIVDIKGYFAITAEGDMYKLGFDKNRVFNRKVSTNIKGNVYANLQDNKCFIKDEQNNVYAYGSVNKNMLLGSYAYRAIKYRTSFVNVDKIIASSSNLMHTTKDGKIYVFGENKAGELGLGHVNKVKTPTYLTEMSLYKSSTMLYGYYQSLFFLKNNNEIYRSGDPAYGLSFGNPSTTLQQANIPSIPKQNISSIIAKSESIFLKTEDGNMYVMGGNTEGELGLGVTSWGYLSFIKMKNEVDGKVINFNDAIKITDKFKHTYVLMNNNQIYSFGKNNNGQLGLGYVSTSVPAITEVTYFKQNNIKIKDIIPGNDFAVFITETNEIYTVGNNDCGQLGIGNNVSQLIPQKVNISDVKEVVTGNRYAIIIKNNGEVFAIGENNYGQCGTKSLKNNLIPTKAEELMI